MSRTATRVAPADPGIHPIPSQGRALGAFDLAILWGDLGIGLLVLVTGALLVPALGLVEAIVAVVIGSVIGVGLLALTAAAGGRHGVPTMVLFRPVLGIRGSWLPSALNAVQLVGWVAVEFWAMSFVADLVAERVFGIEARGLWLVVTAIACTALALWGPVGVTKVWLERFGVWVIAMPISWMPLVADYTRFATGARPAFVGTFWGYLIANVWLYTLGALLVLDSGAAPDPGGIALGILAVAGGSIAGILFLVGLLVGETDEAFANLYSTAVSVQNVVPRIPQRALIVSVAVIGALLAALLTMTAYESFLFLIGSVFVPLFGILAADHFVIRRGRLGAADLYRDSGPYWFTNGFRVAALIPWVVGFLVFHWVNPSPLGWWTEAMQAIFGEPLSMKLPWLPGSIPAFLASFVLALVILSPHVSTAHQDREVTP